MARLSRLSALFASAALVCAIVSCGKRDTAAPAQSDTSATAQSDTSASAQTDAAAPARSPDPPSRVARLSLVDGDVSLAPAGEKDWAKAQLNRPLVTGDKLWTQGNARAELELGAAT